MSPKEWLTDLVNKLSGCKAEVKAVADRLEVHVQSHSSLALKADLQAILTQLESLVEYHNALAKKVESLSTGAAPAPVPSLPPSVIDQLTAINDAFANLPVLPE